MSKRDYIPYRERLASALACLLPQAERSQWRATEMDADCIIELFTFDHIRLHALEKDDPDVDRWFNLDPRLRGKELKAKDRADTSRVAKVRRLSAEHEDFRKRVLSPVKRKRKTKSKWPKRKLRSRSTFR
jgi:hypothetical protein